MLDEIYPLPLLLANEIGVFFQQTSRALRERWNMAWTRNPPILLKTLVDWAVGLRARELAQMGVRPQEIHKALGIHERTLERIADRVAGMSIGDWLTVDSRVVWEGASETVLNIG